MILVIFFLKFLCFLLDPFWFISLIVIRITIITQEFIQANIAILIIINIWKGEKKLWKHYYNNGLFRQTDEITVCSGKNPIWTPSCSFAPIPNPFFTKAFPAGNLINGKTLLQGMGEGRLALSYLKRKVSVKYGTYWGSRF